MNCLEKIINWGFSWYVNVLKKIFVGWWWNWNFEVLNDILCGWLIWIWECGNIKWNNEFVIWRIKEGDLVLVGFWLM